MNTQTFNMMNMFHSLADYPYWAARDLWVAAQVKYHLMQGADVNATTPIKKEYGWSCYDKGFCPIHYAAYHGFKYVYRVLKNAGAHLEAKTTDSLLEETPFQITSWRVNSVYYLRSSHKAYEELAFEMIKNGVDIHKSDNAGYTPLLRTQSANLTKKLIEMGVNLNAQTQYGDTALHRVVETYRAFYEHSGTPKDKKRYADIRRISFKQAELLIQAGIDTTLRNQSGNNALESFRSALYWKPGIKNTDIYQLIKENTPNPHKQKITSHKQKRALSSRFWDWQNG